MWWCLYWFRKDNLREVNWHCNFNLILQLVLWLTFFVLNQAARFFHWFWSTCPCKHEERWANECCHNFVFIRISKWEWCGPAGPHYTSSSEKHATVMPLSYVSSWSTYQNYYSQVESGDLIAYGLIPEFVGRFPILVSLSALNEDQLVQVILVLLYLAYPWVTVLILFHIFCIVHKLFL